MLYKAGLVLFEQSEYTTDDSNHRSHKEKQNQNKHQVTDN